MLHGKEVRSGDDSISIYWTGSRISCRQWSFCIDHHSGSNTTDDRPLWVSLTDISDGNGDHAWRDSRKSVVNIWAAYSVWRCIFGGHRIIFRGIYRLPFHGIGRGAKGYSNTMYPYEIAARHCHHHYCNGDRQVLRNTIPNVFIKDICKMLYTKTSHTSNPPQPHIAYYVGNYMTFCSRQRAISAIREL